MNPGFPGIKLPVSDMMNLEHLSELLTHLSFINEKELQYSTEAEVKALKAKALDAQKTHQKLLSSGVISSIGDHPTWAMLDNMAKTEIARVLAIVEKWDAGKRVERTFDLKLVDLSKELSTDNFSDDDLRFW